MSAALKSFAFALAFALIATQPVFAEHVDSPLSGFYEAEQQALAWGQRYRQATAGSFDERFARKKRNEAIRAALESLRDDYDSLRELPADDIDRIAVEMRRKYSAATAGSSIEQMYREALTLTLSALREAVQARIQETNDFRRVEQLALLADRKYTASRAGSLEERTFSELRRMAWARFPELVEESFERDVDNFREVEAMILELQSKYSSARAGSSSEYAYSDARNRLIVISVRLARRTINDLSESQTYVLEQEYNQKYKDSRAGSALEVYYGQIRNLARARLMRF